MSDGSIELSEFISLMSDGFSNSHWTLNLSPMVVREAFEHNEFLSNGTAMFQFTLFPLRHVDTRHITCCARASAVVLRRRMPRPCLVLVMASCPRPRGHLIMPAPANAAHACTKVRCRQPFAGLCSCPRRSCSSSARLRQPSTCLQIRTALCIRRPRVPYTTRSTRSPTCHRHR